MLVWSESQCRGEIEHGLRKVLIDMKVRVQ